ncbi:hypothetical protein [Lysinibacillus sp. FSL K6-0102]|uniref:hypothetical protein n=1 Tax=Lysinibacillus sp. FSL K6-0102 TaxID=2975290 RepID=UPI0030F8EF9D
MEIIMILFATIIISLFFSCIPWMTHISMTKSYSNDSEWGGYRQFKREFASTNWRFWDIFKYSLFDEDILKDENEYHAGIIKFKGTGMKINNPISYLFVVMYVRKYINKNSYVDNNK